MVFVGIVESIERPPGRKRVIEVLVEEEWKDTSV
jgi:hypothetical protein